MAVMNQIERSERSFLFLFLVFSFILKGRSLLAFPLFSFFSFFLFFSTTSPFHYVLEAALPSAFPQQLY